MRQFLGNVIIHTNQETAENKVKGNADFVKMSSGEVVHFWEGI